MGFKHLAIGAALFLGLNLGQAQTVKDSVNSQPPDTVKTYNMEEVTVTETPDDKKEKVDRLEKIQHSSTLLYGGNSKSLIQTAGIQSQAPGFVPLININNIDVSKYGSFVIDGITVFGDPFYSYGIQSKFEGPFFSPPEVLSTGYPVRYVGLGIVNTKLKKADSRYELSHSPFKSYGVGNIPISQGNIGIYYEHIGPVWYVENTWKETKIYPRSYSLQGVGSVSTPIGRFKVGAFLWENADNIRGTAQEADFDIKQNSQHTLIIADWNEMFSNKFLGTYILRAKFGRENWSNTANQNISDLSRTNYAGNNIDVGVNAITGIVQFENKNNLVGLEYRVLSDARKNEVLTNLDFLSDTYKKYMGAVGEGFDDVRDAYSNLQGFEWPDTLEEYAQYGDSIRVFLKKYEPYIDSLQMAFTDSADFYFNKYNGLSQKEKARRILEYMGVAEQRFKQYMDTLRGNHTFTIRDTINNRDTTITVNVDEYLSKIPDFTKDDKYLAYKKTLQQMLIDDITSDRNSIHMTNLYWEGKIPFNQETTLLEPSIGVNKLSYGNVNNVSLSASVKLTQQFNDFVISGYASKNSAAFERNNLNSVLRNRSLDGIEARLYSISGEYLVGNEFLENIKVEYLHKYFSKNSSSYDAYSKELDVTIRNIARLAYQFTFALGGAQERSSDKEPYHPMTGSINKTMNLVLSWNAFDNFNLMSNLRWHDGYNTDRTTSGKYEKSRDAMYLDIGVTHNLIVGNFSMESSFSCMNILAIKQIGKENEVYRVVVFNPATRQMEVKNFNAFVMPNFEIRFSYVP
jgi:hypothetical protein